MASVDVRNVVKVYRRQTEELRVLDGLTLSIPDGAFVALMGPSGSGKTTLLNLIGGIDQPTSGDLEVAGTNIARLKGAQLARWRSATCSSSTTSSPSSPRWRTSSCRCCSCA